MLSTPVVLRLVSSQLIAIFAFIRVSVVVKVLLEIIIRVVSGSNSEIVSLISVPSTLETKCALTPPFANSLSALHAMRGPRSDPPMPIFTISVIALLVSPRHLPERISSLNIFIFWD